MKRRNVVCLVLVVCASVVFGGCAGKKDEEKDSVKKEEVRDTSVEEYMEDFFETYYIERSEDVATIWKDHMSETTKNLNIMSESEYVSNMEKVLFDSEFTDVLVNPAIEMQEGIYKVNVDYKYVSNGTQASGTETWYITTEDGDYKLLLSGITDATELMSGSGEGSEFSLSNLQAYKTVEGLAFTYDFVNQSGRKIYFGPWAGNMSVTMTTDDGSEHTCSFNPGIMIEANASDRETMNFVGATGKPVKFVFDTITYVGSNGLPEGTTSYTVMFE